MIDEKPWNLIEDLAYESDKLDEEMRKESIEMMLAESKELEETADPKTSSTASV